MLGCTVLSVTEEPPVFREGEMFRLEGRRASAGLLTGFAALCLTLADARGAEPLATAGIGLTSCRKLASDMKPEAGFSHLPNALIFYWIQGYLSAANITMLESDQEYVDLSGFDETLVPKIHEYCTKNPDKKPISFVDQLLNDAPKLKGTWQKGTIPWASE
jgi:hypothetical protein